jgi:hypothetical protein
VSGDRVGAGDGSDVAIVARLELVLPMRLELALELLEPLRGRGPVTLYTGADDQGEPEPTLVAELGELLET